MYRKTYVEIDCNKLENNIKKIINTYSGYKYYFGVVKNNAYGHGLETIKYMINAGINYLAVSSLEEALLVREIDKDIPVLVLEPISIKAAVEASKHNITITIDNKDYYNELKSKKVKLKFHLKIDSGMNRLGLKNKEDINYINNDNDDNLYLEGIYTHLTSGNEEGHFKLEKAKFLELTEDIDLSKIDIVHLDRSLTLEQHDKLEFANGVRLGIIMYGFAMRSYTPSYKRRFLNKLAGKKNVSVESKLELETVFTFKSSVLEIKKVNAGEVVGYGGMHTATEDETIAIVPYGFADYLYNNLSDVAIKGKLFKTIVINMDMTIIKVDDSVKVGDDVEIFGDMISIRKKAVDTSENVYKVLTSVTNRVPRVYKYDDKKYEIKY